MQNKDGEQKEGTTSQDMTSNKTGLVLAFIIGLLVGLLLSPAFLGDRSEDIDDDDDKMEHMDDDHDHDDDKMMEDKNGGSMIEGSMSSDDSVSVKDQLAGDRVLLENVSLTTSGWAVVHEDLNGMPGNALGAARFDAGDHEGGYVKLLRDTESNKLYYVILYADNGDSAFNIKEDQPIADGESSVQTTFNTVTIDRKNN